jgi:hypothetical protein
MRFNIKTEDSGHEKLQSDEDNSFALGWLGNEGLKGWTTKWLDIIHSGFLNADNSQTKKKKKPKAIKKEVGDGECQIPLHRPPNPNPDWPTQAERESNEKLRSAGKMLSKLAEEASKMLAQVPKRIQKQGIDELLQRMLK